MFSSKLVAVGIFVRAVRVDARSVVVVVFVVEERTLNRKHRNVVTRYTECAGNS